MSLFAQPTAAPKPKSKDATKIALFYAVILVVMALAQLFTFEDFLKLVTDFGFPGGVRFAYFLAAFLVIIQVFALPFLLRMPLSAAFRWLSMICGWLVALIWLGVSVWLVVQQSLVENVGFLGTVVDIMPGAWAIGLSAAFAVLAAWASWGMWPKR